MYAMNGKTTQTLTATERTLSACLQSATSLLERITDVTLDDCRYPSMEYRQLAAQARRAADLLDAAASASFRVDNPSTTSEG